MLVRVVLTLMWHWTKTRQNKCVTHLKGCGIEKLNKMSFIHAFNYAYTMVPMWA